MSITPLIGILASAMAAGGGPPPPTGDALYANVLLIQEFWSPKDLSGTPKTLEIRGRDAAPIYNEQVRWDTSKFKFGTRSMRCHEGGEGYIAGPRGNTIDFGTSDWCIEFWTAANSEPSPTGYWYGAWQTLSNKRHMRIGYNPTTNVVFVEISINGTGTGVVTASFDLDTDGVSPATMWDGNFHHIAVRRHGANIDVYVDGLRGSVTGNISTNPVWVNTNANDYNILIGASCNSNVDNDPDNGLECWMDEFRLTIGVPRYTGASFTPPTTIFGRNVTDDPDFANVALLLDFEGEWGCKYYGNQSGVEDAFRPYNLTQDQWINDRFQSDPNTLGYVARNAASNVWNFDSGDFTIEVFKWRGSIAATRTMVANYQTTDGERGWRFVTLGNSNSFGLQWSTDGLDASVVTESCGNLTAFIGSSTLDSATEYDLCIERQGSNLYFYVDGVLVRTASISGAIFDPGVNNIFLGIGRSVSGTGSSGAANGQIKAVRITKGVARYGGGNYTPPTLPLPKST
jgi:hypothetical protein